MKEFGNLCQYEYEVLTKTLRYLKSINVPRVDLDAFLQLDDICTRMGHVYPDFQYMQYFPIPKLPVNFKTNVVFIRCQFQLLKNMT